jgi:putative ABC transport system permease protein
MTDFTSKEVDIDYIENFELFEKRGELYYVIGETENTHFPVIFADDNFYEGAKIIFDKNSTIKNSEELKKNSEALLIPYIFTNEPFSLKLGDKIDFDFRSAIFNMSNLEAFEESEKNFFINREVKITSMLSKEIDTIFALPILSTGEDIELIKKNGFKINYFKLKDYEQKDSVKDFFINQGILFTFADDVIKFINVTIKGVVNIANSFLYFGIIVGILGIAITMFKSVQERTRIIGMLKAIGFNKRMIFQSFLIESSILILLGIISGTASGIFAGYQIYLNYFAGSSVEFFVPWSSLFLIIASFYVVSVVFVFIPSRLASKIPASQAMRNFE